MHAELAIDVMRCQSTCRQQRQSHLTNIWSQFALSLTAIDVKKVYQVKWTVYIPIYISDQVISTGGKTDKSRRCNCIQVAQLSQRDRAAVWVSCGANINVVFRIQRHCCRLLLQLVSPVTCPPPTICARIDRPVNALQLCC